MNITIIGTGYVGLVTGSCLADLVSRQASKAGYLKRKTYRQFLNDATLGNHVFCMGVDQSKKIWRKSWLLESLTS